VLKLVARDLVATFIEHHEPRAGRALVDGTDESRHGGSQIGSRVLRFYWF